MMKDIRDRMQRLVGVMSRGAYEREEAIALSLLSSFAGESIFLLGLPGVGKSMIARRLKSAFRDSTCFEYLMSRFSTPDEIFGPVSISKLKDSDTYERSVDGYLPTADVVFLDEIWKAGPAIQNSLLTALNEKIFHNGRKDMELPLKGIIAASNELPAEGEGLEALWDRFLIRYIVQPIGGRDSFMKLIGMGQEIYSMPQDLPISGEEYGMVRNQICSVGIPDDIMESLYDLRCLYAKRFAERDEEDEGEEVQACPYISDRRWKKIVGVLKASACLNGRDMVDYSDCLLLEHMLWDKDTQVKAVLRDVAQMVTDGVARERNDESTGMSLFDEFVISRDGSSYIVVAGNEELEISKDDYKRLQDGRPGYGRFSSGNRIAVNFESGDFRMKCDKYGTLSINSFTYPLKKRTVRPAVGLKDYTKVPDRLEEIIAQNIFLRGGIDRYPHVRAAAARFKSKRK